MALEVDLVPAGRIVDFRSCKPLKALGSVSVFVLILLLPCDGFGGGFGSCWANC